MVTAPDIAVEMDEVDEAEAVHRLQATVAQELQPLIAKALGGPDAIRQLWQQCLEAGFAGQAELVHAQRENLRLKLDRKLTNLHTLQRIAQGIEQSNGTFLDNASRIPSAIRELEQLRTEIFSHWDTLENLEEMLVAKFPLTKADVSAIIAKLPFPQQWYDENDKPF